MSRDGQLREMAAGINATFRHAGDIEGPLAAIAETHAKAAHDALTDAGYAILPVNGVAVERMVLVEGIARAVSPYAWNDSFWTEPGRLARGQRVAQGNARQVARDALVAIGKAGFVLIEWPARIKE